MSVVPDIFGATIIPVDIAGAVAAPATKAISDAGVRTDPAWLRRILITLALAFLALFIVVPLVNVFWQALSKGAAAYAIAIISPDAIAAITLTIVAAIVAVS